MATGKIRSIGAFCVWLLLLFAAGEVHPSGDGLDLQAELSRPGVKLLVVEFYATWCEPCQKAVPKWKKLHDKYGPKGLRFIVVSVGDDGQCSNPGWSPDRNVCDVDGTIQAEWDVANLPQAFLYSWQGDLLAERAHVEPVEDAIKRFFRKTQLSLYVDEIDIVGDKYAVGSNPAWLKKHISSQIRKQSKFDVLKYRNVPAYEKADHCAASFPANSNLRIQVQGDERGNRTLTLEIEKDGCVLASNQQPYTGKGLNEDRDSLERAADKAVKEILAAVIRIKKPRPPQVFERAGFGEGLDDLQGLRGESGKLRGMSRLEIPRGSMADFDTDYMDLLVAATNVDKSDKKTVDEKIAAWQKVASYSKKTFARDKAERRIKEWQSWQEARVNKAVALKKAFAQYKEDKEKLAKILSYPEDFISKQQKQAYENEFNRAYRDVKEELEQIAQGKHELMSLIRNDGIVHIAVNPTLFDYNGREMEEWQPLLDMLSNENAKLEEYQGNESLYSYDIIFCAACDYGHQDFVDSVFSQLDLLLQKGVIVIISGTNHCISDGRSGATIANSAIERFGMKLSADDFAGSYELYTNNGNQFTEGVPTLLGHRNAHIEISNQQNVNVMAYRGEDIIMATYRDPNKPGAIIVYGGDEDFLYGVKNKATGGRDYRVLNILRNIVKSLLSH